MNKRNLLLITSDFPYGNKGDNAFLIHEIGSLCRSFGRVDILSTSSDSEIIHDLPANAFPHRTELRKIKISVLFQIVLSMLTPRTLKEIVFALKHFHAGFRVIITQIAKYYYTYFILKKEIISLADEDSIVYNYWLSSRCYAAARLKQNGKLRIKTIARCHGFDCYAERGYLPFRREIVANTDEIYFISDNGRNYFEQRFLPLCTSPGAKLRVAQLGLDAEGTYTEPKPVDTLRLVSCSNICPVKRLDRIIDALAAIDCRISWTHIGAGEEDFVTKIKNYALEKLSGKTNIEYKFEGFVAPEVIKAKYAANEFDLLINTSESEGIPVSIMEAFSYSIPAIGLNVGGLGEIIPESSGLLLAADSRAEDIGALIEQYSESDLIYRQSRKQEALDVFNRKYGKTNASKFACTISRPSICIVTASFDQLEYANIDIRKDYGNIVFAQLYRPLKMSVSKAVRRIWYLLAMPGKNVWYSKRLKRCAPYQDSIVVFDSFLGTEIFPYLARRSNAELHCWFWNIVGSRENEIAEIKNYARVWSFDREDCRKYGLNYNHQFYGEVEFPAVLPAAPCVIFVGRNKNRYNDLLALADYLESKEIDYEFYVFDKKLKSDRKNITIIKSFMSYKEVLSIIGKSSCLVDLVQYGQRGLTLRALEAMFHGRQVLTNNSTIKDETSDHRNIFVTDRGYYGLDEFLLRGPINIQQDMNSYSFMDWVECFRRQE